MKKKCVDKGAIMVARCRMNYHPFRLVDNKEVFILVDNIQGYILRENTQRNWRRDG